MFSFEKLKNNLDRLFTIFNSSVDKLKRKIFKKNLKLPNFEYVKVYNQSEFSHAFVDLSKVNLLSKNEFEDLLEYITNSIRQHLLDKNSTLINIIVKIVFKDELDLIYTHSITYKLLFTPNELENWKIIIEKDIKELLNRYSNSQITKLEIRFDYITSQIK